MTIDDRIDIWLDCLVELSHDAKMALCAGEDDKAAEIAAEIERTEEELHELFLKWEKEE